MTITPAMQNTINSGDAIISWMVWIEAKNRTTGGKEAAGIHTGTSPLSINVSGEDRVYQGAGHLIDIPAFTFKQGLEVDKHDVNLSILSPEITNQIRAYNSDLAPTEIHLAVFTPDMELVGAALMVKGFISAITIQEGPTEASCTVQVTTNIAQATRGLTIKKSNESQKMLDPTDDGFKYAAIAGTTPQFWGNDQNGGYQESSFRRRNPLF